MDEIEAAKAEFETLSPDEKIAVGGLAQSGLKGREALTIIKMRRAPKPPRILKTTEEARRTLASLPEAEEQAALLSPDPIHAANLVRSRYRQEAARASVPDAMATMTEAGLIGAGNAATGGNLPGVAAAWEGVRHPERGGTFEERRAANIEDLATIRAQQPGASFGGEVVGYAAPALAGIAAPASRAVAATGRLIPEISKATAGALAREGAKAGAAYGGLYGALSSERATPGDVALSTLGGATVGVPLGVGLALAPGVAARGLGAVTDVASSLLGKAGARADELRVLTASGAHGGSIAAPPVLREAAKVPGGVPEVARVMRETGISKGIATTGGIAKRASAAREEAGRVIGDIIEATDTRGGGSVSGEAIAKDLMGRAVDIQRGAGGYQALDPANAAFVDELVSAAQTYRKAGDMTMRAAQERISGNPRLGTSGLRDVAYKGGRALDVPTSAKGASARSTVEGLRGEMDIAAEKALTGEVPEGVSSSALFKGRTVNPAEAYREARRVYQVAKIIDDAAEVSLGRAGKNRVLGLADLQAVTAGGTVGGVPGATIALAAKKVLSAIGASGRATIAEQANRLSEILSRARGVPVEVTPEQMVAEQLVKPTRGLR